MQHFLEHPEAQVRVNSARTLGKLARGYPDDLRALDLSKAKYALEVSTAAAQSGDSDAEAQRAMLEDAFVFLGLVESRSCGGSSGAASSTSGAPGQLGAAPPARNQRGEVCLKVVDPTDAHAKGGVLEALVAIPGVVSVTFEGPYIVVSTRTLANSVDVVFRAELLDAVRNQGLTSVKIEEHASAEGTSCFDDSACEEIAYVDDEADGEPAYLDDDEDDLSPVANGRAGSGGGQPGDASYPHWSFFSQTNWMTGRRVYEYGDDPTIAARLAKAKKAEEERKQVQKSGFSRLFSMLTG